MVKVTFSLNLLSNTLSTYEIFGYTKNIFVGLGRNIFLQGHTLLEYDITSDEEI